MIILKIEEINITFIPEWLYWRHNKTRIQFGLIQDILDDINAENDVNLDWNISED